MRHWWRSAARIVATVLSILAFLAAVVVVVAIVAMVLIRNERTIGAKVTLDFARVLTGPLFSLFPIRGQAAFVAVNWGLAAVAWLLIGFALRAFARAAGERARA